LRTIVRAIARFWIRARGKAATRIRGTSYWTDPYHIGFWRDVARDRWEPELYDALQKHLRPDSVLADIGAWIGPTAIFAARRCRKVYCFEPDPEAYRFLLWNVRLNGLQNVVPFNVALAAEAGIRRMVSPAGGLGDSKATLLPVLDASSGVDVPCIRWSEWLALPGVERPDFIKIDVEGGEFELLPTMGDYLLRERPTLHLSLHLPLLPEKDREHALAALLVAVGHYKGSYREDGTPVEAEEIKRVARTRLCSFLFTDEAHASR